jgi:signal transduction histidine kinase
VRCCLNDVVATTIDSLLPGVRSRQLALSAGESIELACDTDLVRRIVENLVNNALKFTPPGGSVEVSLSSTEEAARISVRDNGCGIPAQYHQTIFEKFDQLHGADQVRGSGLGLAFCKLAVAALGGIIGLESEVGKGSTFWFTLPMEHVELFPDQTVCGEVASSGPHASSAPA